jgi:hypothetical protein
LRHSGIVLVIVGVFVPVLFEGVENGPEGFDPSWFIDMI